MKDFSSSFCIFMICLLCSGQSQYTTGLKSSPLIVFSNQKDLTVKSSSHSQNENVGDIQEALMAAKAFSVQHKNGYLWFIIDKSLSANQLISRYPFLSQLSKDLPTFLSWEFSTPAAESVLPVEFVPHDISLLRKVSTIPSDSLRLLNVATVSNPEPLINEITKDMAAQPYMIILTGSPATPINTLKGIDRSLAEQEKNSTNTTDTKNLIKVEPHEFASIIIMAVTLVVVLIGLSCLMSVDGPAVFEDKTLLINKEF